MSVEDRLWHRLVEDANGCWIWTGARSGRGGLADQYGHMWVDGAYCKVHRLAYELVVGKIPDGLQLDHLCRNRLCANPAHLEPVTVGENLRRGNGPTGVNHRKTRCKRGHPLSGRNVGRHAQGGWRYCRACKALQMREYRRRLREAAT